MPSSEVAPLRIYCVCGQKMKVSEDMFGRPGKCVACRLKIRIPTPDEIPPNTDVIHLKDHPELLRKVKRRGGGDEPKRKEREKEEIEVAPLPDIDPKGKVRKALGPLDVLEPLRMVHNLSAKVEKQLAAMKASKEGMDLEEIARKDPKTSELLGVRTWIHAAEQDLEEELRQRLMETAIELAATQEKIAELNLAVRVGEMPYAEYRTQVDRLRRRRDNHERRQSNLRGWLTVDDVHRAGGATDVSFDQIPKGSFRIAFANELDENATLLDGHVENLRGALAARAQAERKVSEAKKLQKSSSNGAAADVIAEAKAQHERTLAQVQYARERLEQLADDYSNDVQAIDAQLDHTRGRLQVGQIKRDEFLQVEEGLLRAKTDLTKARALVVRALNANAVDEVPRPRGTFVARLAHGKPGLRAPMDAWIAWAGAALVLAALFVPIAGSQNALQLARADAGPSSMWYMVFPIGVALVAAAVSFVPGVPVRGLGYCALWLLACLMSTAYLHETAYNESPASVALRSGAPLLLRPGIMTYALGLLGIAAAGVMTLVVTRDGRIILPLTAIATVAGIGAVVTDLGGMRIAKPDLRVDLRVLTEEQPPVHEATVTIANNGGRELLLASNSTLANAFALHVEKRIGKNSGVDVSAPVSIRVGQSQVPAGAVAVSRLPVLPGQSAQLVYRLPEGEYRASLRGSGSVAPLERTFTLEPLTEPEPVASTTTNEPEASAPVATAERPRSALMEALSAEVTLRGILGSGDRPAQFSITVTLADGATSERTYQIGEEVFTRWTIREFNPEEQTITLARGSRIVILRRGEPQKLDTGLN